MFNDKFIKLLLEYPDAISQYQKLSGLLRDIFPEDIKLIRLLLNLHEIGIHKEIASTDYISRQFAYKYKKRLVDEYGIGDENAHRGVYVWCFCYGEKILGKPCEITEADKDYVASTVSPIPQIKRTSKENTYDRLDFAVKKSRDVSSSTSYSELFSYTKNNNSVHITAYKGFAEKDIFIPDIIDGLPVKRINGEVFENALMKSITLPKNLEEIGAAAFKGCDSLKSINFPDLLQLIEDSAFEGCESLTNINLPVSLQVIGKSAFSGCKSLTSINLPDSLKVIESMVFSGCRSLKSINLPDSLQVIKHSAFCFAGLVSLVIPEKVIEVNHASFGYSPLKHIAFLGVQTVLTEDPFYFGEPVTIYCLPGSKAQQYARSFRINLKPLSEFPRD